MSANAALPPTQLAAPAAPSFAPTEYAQPQLPNTANAEAKARASTPKRNFKDVFRVSKLPLADYLFPAQTKESRFRRNLWLIIGCSIVLFLWVHVYLIYMNGGDLVNFYAYSPELFLMLLISAFLGKWRGAIVVGAVGVLVEVLSSRNYYLQGYPVGPFLIDRYLPLFRPQGYDASTQAIFAGGIYVVVAFITGWLSERGLDRRFRTSIAAMLPIAFIVSLVGLQTTFCYTFSGCFTTFEPLILYPNHEGLGDTIYVIFQSSLSSAIAGFCIQGLLVALALPLLWKLPRVKQQIKEQE